MRVLIVLAALALVAALAPAASAARSMGLGYFDPDFTYGGSAPLLDQAAADGATAVRIEVRWSLVAPTRPADETDHADPAYDWTFTDRAVVRAAAHGLDVLLCLNSAPSWAEGAGRPGDAPAGAWKPDPAAYERFARAAATRYSGRVPGLPRIRRWQAWNEPNLGLYLSPQYAGRRSVAGPHYRRLANALHRGVHSVDRRAFVVVGATAPFGDPPGGERTRPVAFYRAMLRRRTTFDAWSHHPYGSNPRRRALNRLDAAVPDLGRIGAVVARAARAGDAPRGTRPWVTEIGWDTSPPDPDGVPAGRQARWLSETLLTLWRARVTRVFWLRVRDQVPNPSFADTIQSAPHFADGSDKPAARAFRFPFALRTARRGRALAWGVAPARGRVSIQRRVGGAWRTVRRARARPGRVFTARLRAARGDRHRAVQRGTRSLSWRTGVDG